MTKVLLVGLGAALGAICRYDLTKVVKYWRPSTFPFATLLINLLGALMLGIVARQYQMVGNWYLLLGTGFCGGFTTFSTLSYEAVLLIRQRYVRLAANYIGVTYVGGMICVVVGYLI